MNNPEVLELDVVDTDYSKKYCIFLSRPGKLIFTLTDYQYKESFEKEFDVSWSDKYQAYMVLDIDLYLSKLLVQELVYNDIEFFTKIIPVVDYNKLVYAKDNP